VPAPLAVAIAWFVSHGVLRGREMVGAAIAGTFIALGAVSRSLCC
jgi:hypothetical protein